MERFDPHVPKEPADIKRTTPTHVIEQLAGLPDKADTTCLYGSGCLIPKDIPAIAQHLGITEQKLKNTYLDEITKFNTTLWKPKTTSKPVGRCVFYKQNKCAIHAVKPYQCKIATRNHHGSKIIEWFDINFFVNPKDPQSLREWNDTLKHRETIPGASLKELVPDKTKREQLLRGERVAL